MINCKRFGWKQLWPGLDNKTVISLEWLQNNRQPVKIVGVRIVIRKRHILNSSSTINFYHYHYANQLSLYEYNCNNHNKKKSLYALSTADEAVLLMSAFDGENWPVCM